MEPILKLGRRSRGSVSACDRAGSGENAGSPTAPDALDEQAALALCRRSIS